MEVKHEQLQVYAALSLSSRTSLAALPASEPHRERRGLDAIAWGLAYTIMGCVWIKAIHCTSERYPAHEFGVASERAPL